MSDKYKFPCGCQFDVVGNPPSVGALPLMNVNLRELPDCAVAWDIFDRGLTKGIFQLEKSLGQSWSKRLKPENMEHISALGSILRPGCLNSRDENGISMTEMYCRVKNKECEPPETFPSIKSILSPTEGIMIYQEQLVKIAEAVAGFNLEEQDRLRKAAGKKLAKNMNDVGKIFIEKAKEKGVITEEEAIKLFDNMRKSGKYLFNKSHAMSYAIPGYMSAYVKGHFPVQFFANWLYYNKVEQNKDHEDTSSLIEDAKLFNIKVNPPDFRRIDRHFQTDGVSIWFGLADIRGIGESQLNKIIDNIKDIEIKINKNVHLWTWEDFIINLAPNLSNSAVKGLISTGAFDWAGKTRTRMLNELNSLNNLSDKELEWLQTNRPTCQLSDALKLMAKPKKEGGGCHNKNRIELVLGEASILDNPASSQEDLLSWRLNAEKYYLGAPVTINTVDQCDTSLSNSTCKEFIDGKEGSIILGVEIKAMRTYKTKSGKSVGQKMGYFSVSDGTATLEDVVAFPDVFMTYRDLLIQGNTVLLKGERDKKKDSLIIKHVIQI